MLEYKPHRHIEAVRCHFEAARGGLTFPELAPSRPAFVRLAPVPGRGFSAIPANAAPKRFKRAESSRSFDDNRPAQVDPKRPFGVDGLWRFQAQLCSPIRRRELVGRGSSIGPFGASNKRPENHANITLQFSCGSS